MSIKFLLDENIPFAVIDFLENKDYEVYHIKKMGKAGIKNGEVYNIAEHRNSWIVTRDADFESYFNFMKYNIGGVILFKLSVTKTQHLLNIMDKLLTDHCEMLNTKHLIIIEDDRIMINK